MTTPTDRTTASKTRSQAMLLLFGGILPVVAFAIVEQYYGLIWGTVAGMAFGIGEIIYEKVWLGKVAGVTWFSNALILILGGVSLASQDGIWFKLQPAILLFCFGGAIIGSSVLGKPLIVAMSLKQNPNMPPPAIAFLSRVNLRLGILFLILGGVSTHAAFYWTTEAWAFLKSVGVMVVMFVYLAGEVIYIRFLKDKRPS